MDRLRLMETFVRVVGTGNFSAVAHEEHTTQSVISKQVRALEGQLGTLLLIKRAETKAKAIIVERIEHQILTTTSYSTLCYGFDVDRAVPAKHADR